MCIGWDKEWGGGGMGWGCMSWDRIGGGCVWGGTE